MKTICMKCQILFSGKSRKNITSLPSADYAQRVIKVNLPSLIVNAINCENGIKRILGWNFTTFLYKIKYCSRTHENRLTDAF